LRNPGSAPREESGGAAGREVHADHGRRAFGAAHAEAIGWTLHDGTAQPTRVGVLFAVVADQMVLQQRHDDVGAAGRQAALAGVRQHAALAIPETVDVRDQRCGWSLNERACVLL